MNELKPLAQFRRTLLKCMKKQRLLHFVHRQFRKQVWQGTSAGDHTPPRWALYFKIRHFWCLPDAFPLSLRLESKSLLYAEKYPKGQREEVHKKYGVIENKAKEDRRTKRERRLFQALEGSRSGIQMEITFWELCLHWILNCNGLAKQFCLCANKPPVN